MAKFTVRFREIFIGELVIDAESPTAAMHEFNDKLRRRNGISRSRTVGLRYEIETITIGAVYDSQLEREKSSERPPPKCIRKKRVAPSKP